MTDLHTSAGRRFDFPVGVIFFGQIEQCKDTLGCRLDTLYETDSECYLFERSRKLTCEENDCDNSADGHTVVQNQPATQYCYCNVSHGIYEDDNRLNDR